MNSSWNLVGDAAQYKSYGKSWSNKDTEGQGAYTRSNKMPTGQPTLRSGLISSDFPFSSSQNFYQRQGSPVRQSLANQKHNAEPFRKYNQITGVESSNNPLAHQNDTYEQFVSSRQMPNEQMKALGSLAIQKQNQIYIDTFKDKIMKRGTKGLIGLKRQFKIMDSDGSGALEYNEFAGALQSYKVGAGEEEIQIIFQIFDKNGDGRIIFQEFLDALVGQLNGNRKNIVREAFDKLDLNKNGFLEIDEVKGAFDASRHPDVKSGRKSFEECRSEFFELFQQHHNAVQGFRPSNAVSIEEFLEYHQFVSATEPNEKSFAIFMTGVWNMDLLDTASDVIKCAGIQPEVYGRNAKEQWKYDMHRSLFGKLDNTPI